MGQFERLIIGVIITISAYKFLYDSSIRHNFHNMLTTYLCISFNSQNAGTAPSATAASKLSDWQCQHSSSPEDWLWSWMLVSVWEWLSRLDCLPWRFSSWEIPAACVSIKMCLCICFCLPCSLPIANKPVLNQFLNVDRHLKIFQRQERKSPNKKHLHRLRPPNQSEEMKSRSTNPESTRRNDMV